VTVYRLFSGAVSVRPARNHPLQRLRPDLPAWLGQCLIGAMEKNPEKAFQGRKRVCQGAGKWLEPGRRRSLGTLPPQYRRIDPLRLWQGLALLFAAALSSADRSAAPAMTGGQLKHPNAGAPA
jgi:hypothetical protein